MTIIYLAIAWFVGIWLASLSDGPLWLWLSTATAGFLAALLFRRHAPLRLTFLLLAFLSLGAGRYTTASTTINESHIAYYNGQETTIVNGLVVDEPELSDLSTRVFLYAESILTPQGDLRPVGGLVLLRLPSPPGVAYGDRLQVEGNLEDPAAGATPGFIRYLARQGIYSQIAWPAITVTASGQGNPLKHGLLTIRDRARATIRELLPEPHASLLTGILLGDDSGLPPSLEADFRTSGLTHIIAISGFNIAILTGILLAASRPFLGHRRSAWFVLAGIALYTLLVGADAAVVRAAIMGGLLVIATRLLGRPTFAPAGLFTAALFMALADPTIPWDIGFQLSFAATLGLMLYVGPWAQWTQARLGRFADPETAGRLSRMLSDVVLATMAAMILALPIILYHFGQLSLVSPVANLFVLPAQPGVMIWGGLATLSGLVIPAVGQVIAWVAWLFLAYTITLVRLFAGLPFASAPVSLSLPAVVAIYALIFGLTWLAWQKRDGRQTLFGRLAGNRRRTWALAAASIVAVLAVAWAFSRPDGRLHVAFLNVGQGDATLIQTPSGRQVLVDGGRYPSILYDQLGRSLPFWDRSLDIVIATHPDADHVAALPGLFDRYRVDRLITSDQDGEELSFQALLDLAAANGTAIHHTQAGEVIVVEDGVRIEVLNPAADGRPLTADQHDNDSSVAFRLVYGHFSLLMTGDISEDKERELLTDGGQSSPVGGRFSAVVYKAAHHGARSSSSAAFLAAVRPGYVIISAGEGNPYGHPHEEVLQRAAAIGAAVLRTDELGTIEVISDGEAMWWEAQE